jgi:hypothetical protein
LQARVSEHLAESPWSRALVAGVNDVERPLDPASADRLLARITLSTNPGRSRRWAGFWAPLAATAAALILVTTVWLARRESPATTAPAPLPATPPATVARNEPPPFELPLRPPDVRLSVAALTWRGPSGTTSLVDDLAPALDAFRQSDYARAAQALEPLERRNPRALEPPYYRGISLLFLNDPNGAIDELHKAERLADDTFSADVAWYLAVAEQRAGRTADARARLEPLCRKANPHATDACDAIKKLDQPR